MSKLDLPDKDVQKAELNSTEEKIKLAAKELFLKNGLKRTTIRAVAEKAGTNVALVNYYFRSKNNLFLSIFKEKFANFSEAGYHILYKEEQPFQDRILAFIDHRVDRFLDEPDVPIFIMSEAHYNAELTKTLASLKRESILKHLPKIQQILNQESEKGNIRQVTLRELEMTMISMLVFPFISRNMMMEAAEFELESFEQFIESWRNHVKRVMLSFLKPE